MFEDPAWVEAWDVAFAQLYLDALDADLTGTGRVPRPWRLAFDAPATTSPLVHVLLGINAHINNDLPQALLAVISDDDFAEPGVVDRRRRDHERIDGVLAGRVAAEDRNLAAHSARSLLDRALQPANRWSSQRFLREARRKVWHNTTELQRAAAGRPRPAGRATGRAGAAQRGEGGRPAAPRPGAAAAGGDRVRGAAPTARGARGARSAEPA